ncbi:NmrA-like family protein [Pochonia chlamydosporia 170]|uniref:NmrA-like family protein n=1 Tax=Pochonia chlamydosporia 170 TaxID=1380566 RepID=A0A179FGV4_METCM|nr:NmrA-like family protein [Pochonia chlamydosporia 170]OAQ64752.1 NmrA-like family protein [Pochonia chlamydosporia 170]
MVKIAIAGGSGNIGQEIIDALVAAKKHDILILTRKDIANGSTVQGVTWTRTDYQDVNELANILKGTHTVLSFITVHLDDGNQKRLIDAAVQAGVKRFAPSEWSSSSLDHMSWYGGKGEIREYLRELNKDKKVLEYSLFQPGLLTNYLGHPHNTTKHVTMLETPIDFSNCRILLAKGGEQSLITLTTIQDIARIVCQAIEYEGEWPVIGGISGSEVTLQQLIALGERIRGKRFRVDVLEVNDLKAEKVASSWMPGVRHPSISEEEFAAMTAKLTSGLVLAFSTGAWKVSDEWNSLLPDYKFTQVAEFLDDVWGNRS